MSVKSLLTSAPVMKSAPVGSRVTCCPPPTNTDEDFLILVKPHAADDFVVMMQDEGFEVELGEGYAVDAFNDSGIDRFQSYRCDQTNFIVTIDSKFYKKFMAATKVAKVLNLIKKNDRIMLFQAVLYGNGGDE